MPLTLNSIDHLHVYVSDREKAAKWYEEVLGFTVVNAFVIWAEDKAGPLVIENSSGSIYLALFQREEVKPSSVIAFGVEGREFVRWKNYLEELGILNQCTDHKVSWSLYFSDPDKNNHEITTSDYEIVKRLLAN